MLYPMIQILVTLDYIKYPEALSMQALRPQEARLLALVSREGGADEDKSIGHQKSGWTKMKWSSSCEFMILILYNIVWLYIYIIYLYLHIFPLCHTTWSTSGCSCRSCLLQLQTMSSPDPQYFVTNWALASGGQLWSERRNIGILKVPTTLEMWSYRSMMPFCMWGWGKHTVEPSGWWGDEDPFGIIAKVGCKNQGPRVKWPIPPKISVVRERVLNPMFCT